MKLKRIFSKSVLFTLLLFMIYIFYYALTRISDRATFLNRYVENEMLLIGFGAILILSCFLFLCSKIEKMNSAKIKIAISVAAVLIVIGQIVVINNFPVTPTTDSYMVSDQALALAKGIRNQIDINSFYFSVYSNNNFTVILLSFLYRVLLFFNISNFNTANLVFNAICIDIGIFFSILSMRSVFGIRNACKLIYVFVFSPVFYVALVWSYTNIYSIPIQMAILYLGLTISKGKKGKNLILKVCLLAALSIIGYYIRPTTTIILIAIIICAMLYKLSISKRIKIFDVTVVCSFLLAVVISYMACNTLVSKYVDQDKCTGLYPMTHWIMIGLHDDGMVSSEDNNYTRGFKTTDKMREATIEKIKERFQDYKFSGLVNHAGKKLKVTWTDGSYDYSLRMHQNNEYSPFAQYLSEQKKDFFILYSQAFYVAVLFLVLISIYYQFRKGYNNSLFMMSLALFGTIVFYLIWEGKASYSMPFLPSMYILAVCGGEQFRKEVVSVDVYSGMQKLIGVIVVLSIGTMISVYSIYTEVEITRFDRSVESTNSSCLRYIEESSEVSQEFYTDIPFNTIEIKAKTDKVEESEYRITLKDDRYQYFSKVVSGKDIDESNNIVFTFDKITPVKNQKYEIVIEKISSEDMIDWGYTLSEATDNYKGICTVDGTEKTYDLYMQVYNKYETTYSKPLRYGIACIIVLLFELFSLYAMRKLEKNM